MRKKDQLEQKFKQNLQETYIQRYSDISTETAQFYKSKAIQLYLTEQFCRGSKYSGSKYTNLIERSTEALKPLKEQRSITKSFENPVSARQREARQNLNKIMRGDELSVEVQEEPDFLQLLA